MHVKALNSKFKDAQKLLEKVAVDPDPEEVDKTALKDKLAEVDKFTESLKDTVYTEKSIEAYKETLKSILEDARSVYNDDKATQDDVDGVLSNLTSKVVGSEKTFEESRYSGHRKTGNGKTRKRKNRIKINRNKRHQ